MLRGTTSALLQLIIASVVDHRGRCPFHIYAWRLFQVAEAIIAPVVTTNILLIPCIRTFEDCTLIHITTIVPSILINFGDIVVIVPIAQIFIFIFYRQVRHRDFAVESSDGLRTLSLNLGLCDLSAFKGIFDLILGTLSDKILNEIDFGRLSDPRLEVFGDSRARFTIEISTHAD